MIKLNSPRRPGSADQQVSLVIIVQQQICLLLALTNNPSNSDTYSHFFLNSWRAWMLGWNQFSNSKYASNYQHKRTLHLQAEKCQVFEANDFEKSMDHQERI